MNVILYVSVILNEVRIMTQVQTSVSHIYLYEAA